MREDSSGRSDGRVKRVCEGEKSRQAKQKEKQNRNSFADALTAAGVTWYYSGGAMAVLGEL